MALSVGRLKLFFRRPATCKMPFPSPLPAQEPGLKHSFSCLSMLAFAKMKLFQTTEAVLQTEAGSCLRNKQLKLC